AASCGRIDTICLLLDNGADIEGRDQYGKTALQTALGSRENRLDAASCEHLEVVQLLLDHGVQPQMDTGALPAAARCGSIDIICLLLDNGADIEGRGQYGETALQAAFSSWEGRSDVIQLLLDCGAQLQTDARTLLAAACGGSPDNVRFLIDHGADIEGHDQFGQTALQMASSCGHLEVVQLLL
ncbi:ankyrin repeat-containing domain protein, partial [Vararia minispora EC-137]